VKTRFYEGLLSIAAMALLLGMTSAARAADVVTAALPSMPWAQPAPIDAANRIEARFGVFAHGVGTAEEGTVALNGELVSPRIFTVSGPWAFLVPRFNIGGYVNLGGRTNIAYAGIMWTIPVFDRFFVEAFTGPAVHDGSLGPAPGRSGLGCPVLFNSGANIGYRFTENFSVMATFSHLSNGRGVFGVDCGTNQGPGRNQGLNQYGVRAGYTF
jgi:opacity protein-like surface antigen